MFRTEALRQRIELIVHLIEFGRQLILIQGAPGLGKSSLLDAIEQSSDQDWVFIRTTAGPNTNRTSLLEKIAANLDFVPTEQFSEQEIIEEIQRRLQILDGNGQVAVLLIDDAEVLPADSHSLLLELAHRDDDANELRIVIAADNSDSSVLDQLQASSPQQALIHTVDMPYMDRDQTASLISWWQDQELRADDDARQRLFSAATLDEIYEQSEGVPGDILVLARQKWLTGQNVELRQDPVKKYIALGILALLIIGVATFFAKQTEDPEIEELVIELPETAPQTVVVPAEHDTQAVRAAPETPATPRAADTGVGETTEITPPDPDSGLNAKLQTLEEPSARPPDVVADDSIGGMLAANLAEEVIAELPRNTPEPTTPEQMSADTTDTNADTNADTAPETSQDKSEDTAKLAAKPATKPPKVSIKLRSEETLAPPNDTQIAKATPPVTPKPVSEPPKLPPAAKPETPPKTQSDEYSLANLLRKSPDAYVLQLFGVRDHDAATKYLKKHGLESNSAVVASMHDGQPWFVVIHGRYQTRDAASQAAKSLSQRLENVKPWPRPVASLK